MGSGLFSEEVAECLVDGDWLSWAVEDGEVGFGGGGHGFDAGAGFFAVCHGVSLRGSDCYGRREKFIFFFLGQLRKAII